MQNQSLPPRSTEARLSDGFQLWATGLGSEVELNQWYGLLIRCPRKKRFSHCQDLAKRVVQEGAAGSGVNWHRLVRAVAGCNNRRDMPAL